LVWGFFFWGGWFPLSRRPPSPLLPGKFNVLGRVSKSACRPPLGLSPFFFRPDPLPVSNAMTIGICAASIKVFLFFLFSFFESGLSFFFLFFEVHPRVINDCVSPPFSPLPIGLRTPNGALLPGFLPPLFEVTKNAFPPPLNS